MTGMARAAAASSRVTVAHARDTRGCARGRAGRGVAGHGAGVGRRETRGARRVATAAGDDHDAMANEESGYKARAAESAAAGVVERRPPRGGDAPEPGKWSWTLNWDPLVLDGSNETVAEPTEAQMADAKILIGSCPKSASDVDRLVDEAHVEAIVCLQCAVCHEAMGINFDEVRRRAIERGVMIVQVEIRDFDRLDQAKMLPEAVRKLAAFQAMGKRTYVHCTAGINRASLTVVGYLTFVQQFELEAALQVVRDARPQANPYVVSWQIARGRLLSNSMEDIYLHTQVDAGGNSIDEGGDWIARDLGAAEKAVIAKMFARSIATDLSMYTSLLALCKSHDQQ